jgi:hypothetical protein
MSGELVQRSDVLDLLRRMEAAGALTRTALDLSSRPELDIEAFEAIARFLGRLHDGSKWWVGDLMREAEIRFGESAYQIAVATGRSERTLQNWSWVCSKIPKSRRRAGVSFSAHYHVAALEPSEQSRWLDLAEAERWTSRELRDEIQKSQPEIEGSHGAKQERDCDVLLDEAADAFLAVAADCYGPGVRLEARIVVSRGIELVVRAGAA